MRQLITVFVVLALCTISVSAQTITSAASGNWNSTGTWVGGVVPGASNDVVIANGHTVTINATVTMASLTVGQGASGVLSFSIADSNTATVTGNVTIASGGSFIVPSQITTTGDVTAASTTIANVASTAGLAVGMYISGTGIPGGTTITAFTANSITLSLAATVTGTGVALACGNNHSLTIGGNVTNNGTLDLTNGYSAGLCHVTFNNTTGNQTITGTGTTTRFSQVTLAKGAITNKVLASINVSMSGNNIIFTSGTWEQNAGRLTATSGSISVGTTVGTTFGFSITGSGSAQIAANINNFGALLINTTDSVIVGTADNKIDMTNGGGTATFTSGTIIIYGKLVSASPCTTIINGANFIIDPKGMTAGYALRTTSGTGGVPFTFTSGSITIVNPCSLVTMEAQLNASTAMVTSPNAQLILGQGAGTLSTPNGFRIGHNAATTLGNLTVNTGSVGVTLSTNVNISGTLTLTSSGALGGAFKWTASRYVFNGSAAQVTGSIMPASVKVVVVNNPANVTSSQSLTITDTLYLVSGSLLGPFTAANTVITDVEENETGMPREFSMAQNYPNPFNPSTTIRFSLDKAGFASLRVYDILGRLVATITEGVLQAGSHKYEWSASGVPTGIYFYTLQSGDKLQTRKMVLLK